MGEGHGSGVVRIIAVVGALLVSTEYRVPSAEYRFLSTRYPVLGTRYSILPHDTHASYLRLVLEGRSVALRVRLFHDDLERGLRQASGQPDIRLTAQAPAESLFEAYFGRRVTLELDGKPVTLRVSSAGLEQDAASQLVVWYVLEGQVGVPPRRLTLLDGLLFENNMLDAPMPGATATVQCVPGCPRGGNAIRFSAGGGPIANAVARYNSSLGGIGTDGQSITVKANAMTAADFLDPVTTDGTMDLHLKAGASAIGAGDPADFPGRDWDGQSRPQGAPDAGADERA